MDIVLRQQNSALRTQLRFFMLFLQFAELGILNEINTDITLSIDPQKLSGVDRLHVGSVFVQLTYRHVGDASCNDVTTNSAISLDFYTAGQCITGKA